MNIEEIDKWLDIEYGVSYTELEKIHDWLVDKIQAKDKEIERLNNIINELEKWLKNKIDNFDRIVLDTTYHEQITIQLIYDYLQELKGEYI